MWGADTGNSIIRKWLGQRRPRGAVVPFETPALRMARVCNDEHDGMIAILRDFANNGSSYIVPWSSLPLMAPMSDHDKALHTAVGEVKAATPAQVRAVVHDLALSGALGEEAAARETRRASAECSAIADVELVLILHLLDSCGTDLAVLMINGARWRDADAKSAIAAAAAKVGVRRQELHRRIAEFTRLLVPLGLVAAGGTVRAGWLRALQNEIECFGESIADLPPPPSSDARDSLTAILATSRRTAVLSGLVINMLDYAVLDIAGTIGRWGQERPVLNGAIERLSLMLDEWPALMKSVRDALRGPPDDGAKQLRILCSMLPRVPEPEPGTEDPSGGTSVSAALAARLSTVCSMLPAL